ncbi:uncharacterized protein LOC131237431 isoform X3 [Magnolia sinica]|uniref:uncharacterized protein LOC131237431 isoform X3 n=1 Tax=Magnolia sinica TaxID=86752 RepID=UPI0026582688|nr:uncharacterized protein LOC131237431 isoform X3 [Magnolia sinica]
MDMDRDLEPKWLGGLQFSFQPLGCLKVVELLQSCCEKCKYNSTHCASLSGLLKTNNKQGKTKDNKTTNANEQTRLNSKAHGIINA